MGQYHIIVNLDKRECIDPHRMGSGAKAWEQFASFPSTPQGLFALLICSNERGGGDLSRPPGISEPVLGRWAGIASPLSVIMQKPKTCPAVRSTRPTSGAFATMVALRMFHTCCVLSTPLS